MEQAIAFIRLRISQIGMDLRVYTDLGPAYTDEQHKLAAVLGELENLTTALETFMKVNNANTSND